jgi:hypothetical protein
MKIVIFDEILGSQTGVTFKMTVLLCVAPCSLVEIDRRIRDALPPSPGRMTEAINTSETPVNFYGLHGTTAQKTVIFRKFLFA